MVKLYDEPSNATRHKADSAREGAEFSGHSRKSAGQSAPDTTGFDYVSHLMGRVPTRAFSPARTESFALVPRRSISLEKIPEAVLDLDRVSTYLANFFELDQRVMDEYQRLALSLIAASLEQMVKRVMITSPGLGDGRTTVALSLACAFAREGKRALVVEGDLHRPSALRLLGLGAESGLEDVLRLPALVEKGVEKGIEKGIMRVQPYGFDLFPLRRRVDAATLFQSPFFPDVFDQIAEPYDYVLLDAPPLTEAALIKFYARQTDVALLTLRPGKTTPEQLGNLITCLEQERLFGVVFNKTRR